MKKPAAQEIKRKIDSKIFELQSSLLSEDAGAVDEALLRECAAWFRPQHLQDIVIERSEAEGRCGWPGCGNKLPPWRLAAPLVFDLPEGEQLGRFCERSCMAKTRIYLAAIPPTPPYSRENLVRLVCPPPTAASAGESSGGDGVAGAKGGGTKKVYRRPRRRDIPPSQQKSPLPAGGSPAGAAAPKAGSDKDMRVGVDGLPEEGESNKKHAVEAEAAAAAAVVAVPAANGEEERKKAENGHAEAGPAAKAEAISTTAVDAHGGGGGGGGARGGAGTSTDSEQGGREDKSDADRTAAVRAAFEKVSISEQGEEARSAVARASAGAVRDGAAAPAPAASAATVTSTAAAPAAPLIPAPTTDWENMRFSRTSGGGASSTSASATSAVSLHASLAAAAAETAAANAAGAGEAKTDSLGSGVALGPEKLRNGDETAAAAENPGVAQESPSAAPEEAGSLPARRRSVSFADGTKDDPEPGAATRPALSARGTAAAKKRAAAVAAAAAAGKGRAAGTRRRGGRGGRGSGGASSGRGRGKAAAPAPAPPRKSVVGGVVERAPTVPTPMEPRMGGGGSSARASAGMVEGHLPKIEADMSFRVMPRGGYPGLGGGAAAAAAAAVGEKSGLGDYGLGVDGGPLTGDEIEEEAEEEEEEGGGGGGEGNEHDADENDRAIWRETFGEEMPAEVAAESWIDMSAVKDKEMREEFASAIAPSALLWSALSEWVTTETRAVCRAGRSAAAMAQAAVAAAAAVAVTPAIAAENDGGGDAGTGNSSSSPACLNRHRGSLPADFQARKAGAVAEAIETEARRHARHDVGRTRNGTSDKVAENNGSGGRSEGPTLTGALRHSGVSAMVNMHLSQAERALRTTAATVAGDSAGGGDSDSGRRGLHGAGGGDNNSGSRTKWVWSDTAAKARQGARVPGGWVEEEAAAATLAAAAVPLLTAATKGDATSGNVPARGAGAAAAAPVAEDATEATPGRTEAADRRRAEKKTEDFAAAASAAAAAAAAAEPVPVGGAECRRAVAALIDTLDAGSASAAASLSIAQWKVVSLVFLTAAGLGAGAVGQSADDAAGGAAGGVSACGEAGAGVVGSEEAAGGAEACLRLCGPGMGLSAGEFRILVEVMLDG